MSKVYFSKVERMCDLAVRNPVTKWHLKHGWVWNVLEEYGGEGGVPYWIRIGVFYCTLLCGDGAVLHFDAVNMTIPWWITLAAMRKGIRIVAPEFPLLLATIPADRVSLLRCAYRLGFRITTGSFLRDGSRILLLKYAPNSAP